MYIHLTKGFVMCASPGYTYLSYGAPWWCIYFAGLCKVYLRSVVGVYYDCLLPLICFRYSCIPYVSTDADSILAATIAGVDDAACMAVNINTGVATIIADQNGTSWASIAIIVYNSYG